MPAVKILLTYPDADETNEEIIQQYVNLGWIIQGRINDETYNPRKGIVVQVMLAWLSDEPPLLPPEIDNSL